MGKRIGIILFLASIFLVIIYMVGEKTAQKSYIRVFSNKPQRIVSLSLSADEMLLSLVDKKRLVALTYLSLDPGISNIADKAGQIKEHIQADPERIISLQPDLVVTSAFTPPEIINTLRQAGIRVYVFPLSNSLTGIKTNILALAQEVGEKAKGQQIVEQMKRKTGNIKVKSVKRKSLRCLYYGFSSDTRGKDTQFGEMLQLVGLRNAAAEAGIKGMSVIGKEKLIQLNPEIIFVPDWQVKGQTFSASYAQQLLKDPALASLEAVKQKRVYTLADKHFTCSSQYITLGLEDLANLAAQKE